MDTVASQITSLTIVYMLLIRLFRCSLKKTSKLRVTGLCAGNSPETGEFPAQMGSNAKMFPFDDVIMTLSGLTSPRSHDLMSHGSNMNALHLRPQQPTTKKFCSFM